MLKKLLKTKVDLTINPEGLTISGVSLPGLDVGQCYPDWRAIIPHNTEPRANIAAFMAKYSIEFLKFRLGKGYNKAEACGDGLPNFSIMHYSIYDGGTCGMNKPNVWTWYSADRDTGVIHYLHMLMPIKAMELAPVGSFDTEVTEEQIEAFKQGNKQLAELLEERFTSKITSVTTALVSEIWGRKKGEA